MTLYPGNFHDFGGTLRSGVTVSWSLAPSTTWRWGVLNGTNRTSDGILWFKTRLQATQFARERWDNGPVVYCKYCSRASWGS